MIPPIICDRAVRGLMSLNLAVRSDVREGSGLFEERRATSGLGSVASASMPKNLEAQMNHVFGIK